MRASAWATTKSMPGHGRKLLLEDYEAIGGLSDALTIHADEVMADLQGLDTAVEQVFRALAELDREGRAVRRARRFASLYAETGCREGDLHAVIDRFRRLDCSFLVPPPPAEIENDTVVDIGHEALIRRWKRMSAAPEAAFAGAAGSRRQTGWLWAEAADGNAYRTLLELIRGAPEGVKPTLPVDQVTKRLAWWQERPRTAASAREVRWRLRSRPETVCGQPAQAETRGVTRVVVTRALIVTFVVSAGFGGFAAGNGGSRKSSDRSRRQRQVAEDQRQVAVRQATRPRLAPSGCGFSCLPTRFARMTSTRFGSWRRARRKYGKFVRKLAEVPALMRQFGGYPQVVARAVGLAWPERGRTWSCAEFARWR